MSKIQWDSQLYLRYEQERTQPSVDLASRIDLDSPAAIIDLGCGPGNSTRVLRKRWPAAHITGLDSSTAMIDEARQTSNAIDWRIGFVAGFGTTFAALPDLIAMLRRRSCLGMNPRMAAIMATFQILWVYYGLLILSRPMIAWNVIAVLTN